MRDSGSIIARSWLIWGAIKTTIISKWWAMIIVRSWPSKPSPDRIKRFEIRVEISLQKNRCTLLFFLTLDWFVKQLRNFGAKSWVHHNSLAFRLNRDPIGARLIVIHHRISSNFPLEFRTSARKKSRKIRFNPRELKPHPCGNRVSSEIWSIIRL